MKRISAASVGLFALLVATQPAAAADIPIMPVKAPAVTAPAFSWTGMYVGGTVGYGWGETHQTDLSGTGRSPDFNWDGFVAGGTLGYNWQSGNVVWGLETDISWSGIKGSLPEQDAWGCFDATCHNEIEWFGTVRGRVGVATDRFLPYVTGGLAYGKVYGDFSSCSTFCVSDTRLGWTVGAGVEWAFAPNWSAKVEYLYVDLGDFLVVDPVEILGVVAQFNVVRFGVNYKFATGKAPVLGKTPAPVVTKY